MVYTLEFLFLFSLFLIFVCNLLFSVVTSNNVNKFFETVEQFILVFSMSLVFVLIDTSAIHVLKSFTYVFVSLFTLFILLFIASSTSAAYRSYEYIILLVTAVICLLIMVDSLDLFLIFLAMEVHSLCMFILIMLHRGSIFPVEASLKYLFLSGLGSSLYAYGVSLIYGTIGTIDLVEAKQMLLLNSAEYSSSFMSLACICICVGLFLKLALVPFHAWAPDVYQAAPVTVSLYMATVSKFIFVIVTLQVFSAFWIFLPSSSLYFISIFSVIFGGVVALFQTNYMRFMAYSGISHMGILFVTYIAFCDIAFTSVIFYMFFYIIMNFVMFASFLLLDASTNKRDFPADYHIGSFSNFIGLGESNPLLAAIVCLTIFSMSGMPPFIGFFSKYFVLLTVFNAGMYFTTFIFFSVFLMSSFYYIRIIKLMYFEKADAKSSMGGFTTASHHRSVYTFFICNVCFFVGSALYFDDFVNFFLQVSKSLV